MKANCGYDRESQMTLKIMNQLEVVLKLRQLAKDNGGKLTLRAASAIAKWIKEQ